MTDPQHHPKKPSAKQLRYLRDLTERCGESFAYPVSSAQASAETSAWCSARR